MKSIVSVFMFGALLAFLSSCNDSGGGSKATSRFPSLAEQKSELQSVQASRENAQLAIPAGGPVAPDSASFQMSAADARVKMQNKLFEAIERGDCKVEKTGLEGATSAAVDPLSDVEGTLEVSGPACFVVFSLSVKYENTQSEMKVVYRAKYSVVEPGYRALNDVDSFEMHVEVGADVSSGRLTSLVENRIHSQTYGDLTETGSGEGTSGEGRASFEMKVTDSFKGYSIERAAGFSIRDQVEFHYAVNGSPVAKEEFESYGRVQLPMRDAN